MAFYRLVRLSRHLRQNAAFRNSFPPLFLPAINHTPGKVCLARRYVCLGGNAATGLLGSWLWPLRDIPILSMLRTRLDWAQARQRVLAENVANADTPKFRGHDLAPLKFDDPPLAAPGRVLRRFAHTHRG